LLAVKHFEVGDEMRVGVIHVLVVGAVTTVQTDTARQPISRRLLAMNETPRRRMIIGSWFWMRIGIERTETVELEVERLTANTV
jgi:hypothetical protein